MRGGEREGEPGNAGGVRRLERAKGGTGVGAELTYS